jgi:hypothetical protein
MKTMACVGNQRHATSATIYENGGKSKRNSSSPWWGYNLALTLIVSGQLVARALQARDCIFEWTPHSRLRYLKANRAGRCCSPGYDEFVYFEAQGRWNRSQADHIIV